MKAVSCHQTFCWYLKWRYMIYIYTHLYNLYEYGLSKGKHTSKIALYGSVSLHFWYKWNCWWQCLARQNVGGQRIKDGFVNRTLPHFAKGSREPKARGFVQNSFYSASARWIIDGGQSCTKPIIWLKYVYVNQAGMYEMIVSTCNWWTLDVGPYLTTDHDYLPTTTRLWNESWRAFIFAAWAAIFFAG